MDKNVPIYHKPLLTLSEAAEYFGIGINRLRVITDGCDCPYVLYVGCKCLIKRVQFEQWLENEYSI